MKRAIFATDRCILFKNIATDVWNRITYAHDVDSNLPEVGITADIIVDILQFSKNRISNFDVFAKPGWSENIYGSDIDVFVETNTGQFRWFALQAKILKKNNRYDTLRDSSDGIMQWEKLKLLEACSGCKSFYLLYNGKTNLINKDYKYDLCNQVFQEDQFGCSLVEPVVIEDLAQRTSSNGNFINPRFEDIHPSYAQPWRILTCCYHNTSDYALYSVEQIIASNPKLYRLRFDKMQNDQGSEDLNDKNGKSENNEIPFVENNPINRAMIESKWNPSLRIIVRRTDSLTEYKGEN